MQRHRLRYIGIVSAVLLALCGWGVWSLVAFSSPEISRAGSAATPSESYAATREPGFDTEPARARLMALRVGAGGRYSLSELAPRPASPLPWRVGVQIGHYENNTVPPELTGLLGNTGATWGALTEADINAPIVDGIIRYLEAEGVTVDRLPATVPPGYLADAFISVHADGNPNPSVNGFKIAGPRRDYSGRSAALVTALTQTYGAASGLVYDDNVTRRMTAYYAFNWPRYEHAVHPQTPAAIVETGFLTSAVDRAVIVSDPDRVARGIAEGIIQFLQTASTTNSVSPLPLVMPPDTLSGELVCAPLRTERRVNADRYGCMPAMVYENNTYLIDGISTSTNPIGSVVTVSGTYHPVQTLDTYFWFPYEVVGIMRVVDERTEEII